MDKKIFKKNGLNGEFTVPGDKSISHRSVMLGAIAKGETKISGFLTGEDCLSTISCFRKLGIEIEIDGTNVLVKGKGLKGLNAPTETLDVGNSGTTLRLLSGLLSAQNFNTKMTGDSSIQKRPMGRVMTPLSQMGATITGTEYNGKICAPIEIKGSKLNAINYTLPVASAQVKSSIILAALSTEGVTTITEPEKTRDHTEIMLNYLGANIERENDTIICNPVEELYGKEIIVPGDISSAAFYLVAASIVPNSNIKINNVGLNPTRTGIIAVLESMGANIAIENERTVCGEIVGDLRVTTSNLKGTTVAGDIIPTLIDEIPIIAVAAAFAEGETIIKDAQELKVKESNRIKTVVCELTKFGVDIKETDDGMIINGNKPISGAICESYHDHRIAMSMAVCGLLTDETTILNSECIDISFPGFFEIIESL